MAARRFAERPAVAGPGSRCEKVGRGLAAGDIDNDGDLDLLVTNNGRPRSSSATTAAPGSTLLVRLIGTKSNRDGIGARLLLTSGTRTQMRVVKAGSSYLGQNELRQHFGLGSETHADRLEVKWPSGLLDVVQNLPANQIVTIREGDGVTGRQPFHAR